MPDQQKNLFGFEILRDCGSGAYGSVYLCRDISQKRLALKVIEKHRFQSGWERELKGITRYRQLSENSSGLLKIYHVGEDDRYFYYTMEPADNAGSEENYIPDTLAFRLAAGPLPTNVLLATLRQLLSAIRTLHNAGYAHRDIKPENILFVQGRPVLADLGLVAPISGTVSQFAGTIDFLPPEERTAFSSDSRESRQRNDLYAFGKLVYCCVTGREACDFPSTSADMPLELPRRLLFRLCLRLCDRESDRRMTRLEELVSEFSRIELTCRRGESWSDKVSFHISSAVREFFFASKRAFCFICRHWILSLICLTLLGGVIWFAWPSPPFDIAKVKSKVFRQETLGIELNIPVEWEILSPETTRKLLKEMREEKADWSELEKKRMDCLEVALEQECNCIFCGYDERFIDNIMIQSSSLQGKVLSEMPDDELRLLMQQLYRGELGFDTKIFECKRVTLSGHLCIHTDLSYTSDISVSNYVFPLEDKCFSITLTAKNETFAQRKAEFQSVLSTLRFLK